MAFHKHPAARLALIRSLQLRPELKRRTGLRSLKLARGAYFFSLDSFHAPRL